MMLSGTAMKIVVSETPPYFIDLDAPTLRAYEIEIGGMKIWRVWCYCDRWMTAALETGHRIAHCVEQTPYFGSGYNLAYAGPWSEDRPEAASVALLEPHRHP